MNEQTEALSAESQQALTEVVIYVSGLVACSVCAPADMSIEDIEGSVNQQIPTGINSRWRKADEPFAGGESNPSPCSDGPLKLHYLLVC